MWGWYNFLIKVWFQVLLFWLMRSTTIPPRRLFLIRLWFEHLNQSGWVRGIWWPSPITQWPSFKEARLGLVIFLQIHEWRGLVLWSFRVVLGKYLALYVLTRREFGDCCNLQYCLANKAWLMVLKFFRPSPLLFLSWQMVSHLIKWSFLFPTSCPHQKDLAIALSLLHVASRTLK